MGLPWLHPRGSDRLCFHYCSSVGIFLFKEFIQNCLLFLLLFINRVYVCACVCALQSYVPLWVHGQQITEYEVRYSAGRVTDDCDPLNMSDENPTQVLWKSRPACFYFVFNCVCMRVSLWVLDARADKCPRKPEADSSASPGAGVTGTCELPSRHTFREHNSGPLQAQYKVITAEPFLQPPYFLLKLCFIIWSLFLFIIKKYTHGMLSRGSDCHIAVLIKPLSVSRDLLSERLALLPENSKPWTQNCFWASSPAQHSLMLVLSFI